MGNGDFEQHTFQLNGQVYRSLDEIPQPFRDSVAALMADRDGNGIPDIFEGDAENLQVVHRSFDTYEVDGVQYSSIDDVPEPQRTALRRALAQHDAGVSAESPATRSAVPYSPPVAAANPIVTPAGRSRRSRLLISFIAIDVLVMLLVVYLITR